MAEIFFWGSLSLLFYTYVGYPLVLVLLARWRKTAPHSEAPDVWPTVSVVLAAHNEDAVIRGRIENLLGLDYPKDRLEIFVVSDASTDRTDSIVGEYRNRGVTFMA